MTDLHIPQFTQGDRLRKAREDAGIGVQEMAKALGYGRDSVTRWERDGKPTRAVLMGYAALCRVPLDWLETGRATARYLRSVLLSALRPFGPLTLSVLAGGTQRAGSTWS